MSDKQTTPKAGVAKLSDKELEQAQGGVMNQFPAGQGGLDLMKTQPTLQKPSKIIPKVGEKIPDIDDW